MSWLQEGTEREQTLKFGLLMIPVMIFARLAGRGIPQDQGEWLVLVLGALIGAAVATVLWHLLNVLIRGFRARRRP